MKLPSTAKKQPFRSLYTLPSKLKPAERGREREEIAKKFYYTNSFKQTPTRNGHANDRHSFSFLICEPHNFISNVQFFFPPTPKKQEPTTRTLGGRSEQANKVLGRKEKEKQARKTAKINADAEKKKVQGFPKVSKVVSCEASSPPTTPRQREAKQKKKRQRSLAILGINHHTCTTGGRDKNSNFRIFFIFQIICGFLRLLRLKFQSVDRFAAQC